MENASSLTKGMENYVSDVISGQKGDVWVSSLDQTGLNADLMIYLAPWFIQLNSEICLAFVSFEKIISFKQ